MATQNSSDIKDSGIVSCDGLGAFSGRTISGETDYLGVSNGDGISGNPTLSIPTNFKASGSNSWNGAVTGKGDSSVTSDGATITFSVEKNGGGDLVAVFSDGYYDWDCTPADTVTLTAGTDSSPQINYVYLLQSTKTLTASTVGWPAGECVRVAEVICQSAASLVTQGPYSHHQYLDDCTEDNGMGHITDLTFWIRQQNATYLEGIQQTYNITTNAGSADNVILNLTSGNVLQLHQNGTPTFSGTPDIYVINDSGTAYNVVTDLNALLTDSTGASMSGRYFSLVFWLVVNQVDSECKIICNLPSGSYNSSALVTSDPNKYSNFSIPTAYKGNSILVSQWNLRHQTSSNGTWTSIDEIDLRGLIPAIGAGGSAAFPTEFTDATFRIDDDSDPTKKIAFQASGITTSTVRTLTVQDADGTIALTAATGGGTGQTTYATGDILYASASNTLSKLAAGSNDDVLTLAAGVPSWAAPSGGGWYPLPTYDDTGATAYFGVPAQTGTTSNNVGNKRLYLTRCVVGQTLTCTKMETHINLGVAGAVGRMGIYSSDSSGFPSSLLVDGGTFSAATSSSDPTVTISQSLTAGVLYWLGITIDENGGSVQTRAFNYPCMEYNTTASAGIQYYYQDSVDPASSLPSTLTLAGSSSLPAPMIVIYF